MMHKAWSSIEEVPYCFWRSSVKFQGHTAKKNCRFWPKLGVSRLKNRRFESNLSKITRPVAAIKSLRFALFIYLFIYLFIIIIIIFFFWGGGGGGGVGVTFNLTFKIGFNLKSNMPNLSTRINTQPPG